LIEKLFNKILWELSKLKPYRDLLSVLILALLSAAFFLVPQLNIYPLYLIPYLLLILVLPGYALAAVIKASIYNSSIFLRALYSVNLSIIISIILFLVLNNTGSLVPFYLVLSYLTILLTILAFLRRYVSRVEGDETEEKVIHAEPVNSQAEDKGPIIIPTDTDKISDQEIAVKVEDVSMEFNLSTEKVDNIKEYVIKLLKRELFYQEFWALKHVSFDVRKGEKLGIIGLNGAGKSTLLKLISGVMKPTEGKIEVHGGVVPLLELGGGFNTNYTGKENIFLRGALLGYSKEFMESKYNEIVEFSELEEFIDVPVKNYSSGMTSRLGFSISTIVKPQILILDEVLAAGDAKFRKKSQERMNSLLNKDTTVLLVSHSMNQIESLCTRAVWLEKGKLVMDGPADEVCNKYLEAIQESS
jgi:ABC-type polysaccharide/polyol phosphate transport system ATPase subunit